MKLAILISSKSKGSNLINIHKKILDKTLNASIYAVISTTKSSPGIKYANYHNLNTYINDNPEKLLILLKKINPDYIVLAGWKQIIAGQVIDSYKNKILNLHPGLIPDSFDGDVLNPDGSKALWNRGKYQDDAIKEFLNKKITYAGSSIHFLSHKFDFGIVLGRVFEKIKRDDTIESLYQRLKIKENNLYIEVIKKLCNK